jgi:hypothetical protein
MTYSITDIDDYAFYGCSDLTSVSIPSTVTIIGISAFENCTGLTNVIFERYQSKRYTKLGENSFRNTIGINSTNYNCITIMLDNGYTEDNLLIANFDILALKQGKINNSNSAITYIGNNAFYGCSKLTNVIIPLTVTSIGISSFENCTGLTNIVLEKYGNLYGYTTLGQNSFYNTTSINDNNYNCLTTMYINGYTKPNLLNAGFVANTLDLATGGNTTISNSTITYITPGTSKIVLPNSVTSILPSVLSTVKSTLTDFLFPTNIQIENIDGLFQDCILLTNISIPPSVISIGANTFNGCIGLKNVTISSNVSTVDSSAFTGTSNVSLVISSESDKISNDFLKNITQISETTISNGIKIIGARAFEGCTGLKTIKYN